MRVNFSKLPTFVNKTSDFYVLFGVRNFAKSLAKEGCGHVEAIRNKKDFVSELFTLAIIQQRSRKDRIRW